MPQMVPIQISVVNASTVLDDAEVRIVVDALQKQVTHDFRPPWGVDAKVTFIPKGSAPQEGTWWLTILDDSDQAGALGYHDLTTDGLPLGKVFAATDLKYGYTWSVTASHELLEMLADPNINLTALIQNTQTTGTLYAYEICDACESDRFGYEINNVLVSDFVLPAWFEDFRAKSSTQFDQTNQIQSPLQLLAGGYIGVFEINSGTGWHQITGEKRPTSMLLRGNVGSRRERRATPRYQWLTSLPHKEIVGRAEHYRQQVLQILSSRVAA